MPIQHRPSDVRLNSEQILSRISGYDIFKAYCPNFVKLGEDFCSDLREDPSPSCRIVYLSNDYIYYDFSTGDSYGCFKYLMIKFGMTHMEVLKMVDRDFGLGLDGVPIRQGVHKSFYTIHSNPPVKNTGEKKIAIKSRPWRVSDGKVWLRWGIHHSTLVHFGVVPVKSYTLRGVPQPCDSATYAYKLYDRHKIYKPLEQDKTKKWLSDVKSRYVQGWEQLPETGELVIITSSLKDCMVLYEMGYHAVALHSESQLIFPEMVKNLQGRFKRIILLYDNDWNTGSGINHGQKGAEKNMAEYPGVFKNVVLPTKYHATDPAELVEALGFPNAKSVIHSLIRSV